MAAASSAARMRGPRLDGRLTRGFAPDPDQGALPLGSPPRGEAPWDLLLWLVPGGGPAVTYQGPCRPPSWNQPSDRLQRASPFAGGPGGKAPWRVSGRSPECYPAPATDTGGNRWPK